MESLKRVELKTRNELLPEFIDTSDLELTDETVNATLKEHPGRYAWIATLHGRVKALRKAAEVALKTVTAEAYLRAKKLEGKITEDMAKSLAQCDPAVLEANIAVNDLTNDEEVLAAIREACRDKKDCAIELGRDLRQQFGQSGSPSA